MEARPAHLDHLEQGEIPSQEFPHMLTDNIGARARNPDDTVVETVMATLRLGELFLRPAATAILPKGLGVPIEGASYYRQCRMQINS